MSSIPEETQLRKRGAQEAQFEVKRALKKARQDEKNKARGEARAWTLSSFLLHASLIIYSLSGYTAGPAAKFLLNNGRQRHWPEKREEELEAMVEGLFLEFDLQALTALADVNEPSDPEAMRAALAYVEQWQLVQWTSQLNARQGVAPSTERVLREFERRRLDFPDAVRPKAVGSASDAKARMWLGAWRRRWGGRYGRIRVREHVVVSEMRSKARVKAWRHGSSKSGPGVRKRVPVLGTPGVPILSTEFGSTRLVFNDSYTLSAFLGRGRVPILSTDSVLIVGTLFEPPGMLFR